ncbi:MAG: methylenetetrahydrofolate reductase [Deltaproteobacteria bacterium]|nr:methylenetetrahydrofolate reductase [Deltaproteobacteria bacterium]
MSTSNGLKSGSNLERVLRAGHFAVTGELGPPQGADREHIAKKAGLLKGAVDAVNVTDNQTAVVRMSSLGASAIAVQEGIEPVMQMTCRDRNRLAMQADYLAAYALGVRNLLALTGDHQSFGNHPTAKNVHDLDSLQQLRMMRDLRDQKKFQCGDVVKGQEPRFFIGAAAAPEAHPIEWRPYRLAKKAEAGADFVQTQLVYNVPAFKQFMEEVRKLRVHEKLAILVGVGPLKGPVMARYMRDFVPGITMPEHVIERLESAAKGIPAEEKEARQKAWRSEGTRMCVELIQELREIEGVAGVHVMAIEWEEAVRPIVQGAGLLPRPTVV